MPPQNRVTERLVQFGLFGDAPGRDHCSPHPTLYPAVPNAAVSVAVLPRRAISAGSTSEGAGGPIPPLRRSGSAPPPVGSTHQPRTYCLHWSRNCLLVRFRRPSHIRQRSVAWKVSWQGTKRQFTSRNGSKKWLKCKAHLTAFQEWTADKMLRQLVFLGLRDDKKPTECRMPR